MPAINFKKDFVGKILNGDKKQTVRKERQKPIKPGDNLFLFTGMRTKDCKLISKAKCTAVEPISISKHESDSIVLIVSGQRLLSVADQEFFAMRDGLTCWNEFFAFIRNNYGIPFSGVIIHWELIKE